MAITPTTPMQQRSDLASLWAANNPILRQSEIGVEADTTKWKLGDGVTAWNSLHYQSASLSGYPVSSTPTTGQILQYSGTTWIPQTVSIGMTITGTPPNLVI